MYHTIVQYERITSHAEVIIKYSSMDRFAVSLRIQFLRKVYLPNPNENYFRRGIMYGSQG